MTLFPVKSISLTDKEKEHYDGIMSGAYHVLKKEDQDTRSLRDNYKKGRLRFVYNKDARQAMEQLGSIEDVILAAYIRAAAELSYKFSRGMEGTGREQDDFMSIAAIGIYDAMYTFNGDSKFCTYAWFVMQRRLIDYVRSIKRERPLVALEHGETIPVPEVEVSKEVGPISLAIDKADLTDFERELVDAHMTSDYGWQSKWAKTKKNPSTGKLYSPSYISLVFRTACDKIGDAHLGIDRKAAA